MIVTNSPVNIDWAIEQTGEAAKQAASYYDLLVQAPDGTTTYTENFADSFTAPSDSTPGSLVKSLTFTQEGLYQVMVTTGNSDTYTVIAAHMLYVLDAETTYNTSIHW